MSAPGHVVDRARCKLLPQLCAGLLLIGGAGLASCTTSVSMIPTTPTVQVVLPPLPVHNDPPIIQSLTVDASRAEVDDRVGVAAAVQDAETPVENLTFLWTATAGTFDGGGPAVTWRLPKGTAATPLDVAITLDVVEHYQDVDASGQPVTREYRVSRTATPLRVHDSPVEISRIALAFLVDLFGNSTVSPSACLVSFSDTCRGKADELGDVENNRRNFVILSATARVDRIDFDLGKTSADVVAPCTFHDRRLDDGVEGTSDGDCLLTAIYERQSWWLCDSHFRPH